MCVCVCFGAVFWILRLFIVSSEIWQLLPVCVQYVYLDIKMDVCLHVCVCVGVCVCLGMCAAYQYVLEV